MINRSILSLVMQAFGVYVMVQAILIFAGMTFHFGESNGSQNSSMSISF